MKMSPTFKRKKQDQAARDSAHHTRKRERFREEEALNVTARFGDRETFGRKRDVEPKRGLLARLRRTQSGVSSAQRS